MSYHQHTLKNPHHYTNRIHQMFKTKDDIFNFYYYFFVTKKYISYYEELEFETHPLLKGMFFFYLCFIFSSFCCCIHSLSFYTICIQLWEKYIFSIFIWTVKCFSVSVSILNLNVVCHGRTNGRFPPFVDSVFWKQ